MYVVALLKTSLKYLRPTPTSLRFMNKTKLRLFVIETRVKTQNLDLAKSLINLLRMTMALAPLVRACTDLVSKLH